MAEDEKTKNLLAEREAKETEISKLKSECWDLTVAMCKIEGSCPRCQNWHYPHC